jgi:predicted AlkP superfamily pyrophosphatase or phosphodiesterase
MRLAALFALVLTLAAPALAQASPVLMISIDGLRPLDVIEADQRGIKVPNLRKLMAEGAYAQGVRNSLPTVTYPNHTTLITGVWPAKHGVAQNATFDPQGKNQGGWYWYTEDIKVPTLWDVAHSAGLSTASVDWPVSVGARSVDWNIPEYWRARNAEDLKLLRALSTPGLIGDLEHGSGLKLANIFAEDAASDDARAAFAAALIRLHRPQLFTLHLVSLDHAEHVYGPGTPEAKADLERIDAAVGKLVADARVSEPDLTVAIVSDHGFAPLEHEVNLLAAFADAGLLTLTPKTHKVTTWQAMPWGGASTAVVLADPKDEAVKARVKALLDKLAADPNLGINRVIDADEIARMGGTGRASFWIDFKLGYEAGYNAQASAVYASSQKGTHGWFPDHPEMRATFIITGPGAAKHGALGEIDQRDIAPTIAHVLGLAMPSADGKSLF